MCLTNCGSVSNHSLLRSRETAVAGRFPNVRSLPESSINAGADANGPCFPPVMAQKALSMSTSPVHGRDFSHTSRRVWREGWRRCPMASHGRHLAASPDALSKNQRLRASDVTRQTGGEVAARSISMQMVRVFLLRHPASMLLFACLPSSS